MKRFQHPFNRECYVTNIKLIFNEPFFVHNRKHFLRKERSYQSKQNTLNSFFYLSKLVIFTEPLKDFPKYLKKSCYSYLIIYLITLNYTQLHLSIQFHDAVLFFCKKKQEIYQTVFYVFMILTIFHKAELESIRHFLWLLEI